MPEDKSAGGTQDVWMAVCDGEREESVDSDAPLSLNRSRCKIF